MKKTTVYTISLWISIPVAIVGAFYKIQHWEGARFLLSLATILSLPYIYLGIRDAFEDEKNNPMVKFMWGVGFIFVSWITGLVYLQTFSKRNSN